MVFHNKIRTKLSPFLPTLRTSKAKCFNVDTTECTEDTFFQQLEHPNESSIDFKDATTSMTPVKVLHFETNHKNGDDQITPTAPTVPTKPSKLTPEPPVKASPPIANNEEEQHRQQFRIHYFYGSPTAIQIYCTVIAAIGFRRLWILHGITFVLLKVMFWRIVAWGGYLIQLKEARQGIALIKWLIFFWLHTAEGALEGKNVSRLLTGSAIQFWKKTGTNIVIAFLRDTNHRVHESMLQDIRAVVAQAELARQRHLARFSRKASS